MGVKIKYNLKILSEVFFKDIFYRRAIKDSCLITTRCYKIRSSNFPEILFFSTLSQLKNLPIHCDKNSNFGRTCAKARAEPRLKRPSLLPNLYGIIAPVRTIVFVKFSLLKTLQFQS